MIQTITYFLFVFIGVHFAEILISLICVKMFSNLTLVFNMSFTFLVFISFYVHVYQTFYIWKFVLVIEENESFDYWPVVKWIDIYPKIIIYSRKRKYTLMYIDYMYWGLPFFSVNAIISKQIFSQNFHLYQSCKILSFSD